VLSRGRTDGAEEVVRLRAELARAGRIIDALIERVERATDFSASDLDGTNYRNSAFSVFETAVAWEWRVRARTADQHRSLNDLAKALADLEHVNAALQREIRERTTAEAALIEAKQVAEQLNAEKTRFLAAVSHDLIQPLNAARLFAGALANHSLPEASQVLVGQTSSALDSVEEILEALLEIAQFDGGAVRPSIEPLDLDALLEHLSAEFEPFAQERRLTLETICDGIHVRSDARLLRRILQNLISNALRYTETGGVRVVASQKDKRVTIEVRDTGPGIARKDREIIFHEFSRLDRSRGVGGAGLGLAIVQRAVRMLRHRLSLTSRIGVGSTFRLTLPAARDIQSLHHAQRADLSNQLRGSRILVIENEPGSLVALVALLEGWGCIVDAAQDEDRTMHYCRLPGYCPDLLVADYHLDDDLTGESLIAAIRARIGQPIPAIVVTADRDAQLRSRLTGLGLSVLSKPVKPDRLRALIESVRRAPAGIVGG